MPLRMAETEMQHPERLGEAAPWCSWFQGQPVGRVQWDHGACGEGEPLGERAGRTFLLAFGAMCRTVRAAHSTSDIFVGVYVPLSPHRVYIRSQRAHRVFCAG